jgi:hypothetical protein
MYSNVDDPIRPKDSIRLEEKSCKYYVSGYISVFQLTRVIVNLMVICLLDRI